MSSEQTLRQLLAEVERTRANLKNSDNHFAHKLADVHREIARIGRASRNPPTLRA